MLAQGTGPCGRNSALMGGEAVGVWRPSVQVWHVSGNRVAAVAGRAADALLCCQPDWVADCRDGGRGVSGCKERGLAILLLKRPRAGREGGGGEWCAGS